jgi:Flp pilus assembly protein TadD
MFFAAFVLLCLSAGIIAQVPSGAPAGPASGAGGRHSIVGSVITPSGQRLTMRVKVKLVSATRGDISMMTDDNGFFAFRGLVAGSYMVIIDKEKEYGSFSQTVDIRPIAGDTRPQEITLSIRLEPAAVTTDAKPGVIQIGPVGSQRAQVHYSKGVELAGAGKRTEAIEEFKLAVKEDPKFVNAFNELGVQYLRLNDLINADEAFRSALKIDAESFAPMMNFGIVLVLSNRYPEAEVVLRSAIKLDEKSPVARYFLGQALGRQGNFTEAVTELNEAIRLGGAEMKEAHRLLAIVYNVLDEKGKAADELEKYLKLAPDTADAEQLRAAIQQWRGAVKP